MIGRKQYEKKWYLIKVFYIHDTKYISCEKESLQFLTLL